MRGLVSQLALGVVFLTVVLLSSGRASATDCISFVEARRHMGQTQCVSGTVFHVKQGRNGVTFLDFCEDYEVCPFTVVVFASDLRKVGDVRQLKGRQVQVQGTIEEYDGRAEIILKIAEQLGETAALLPPLSRDAALTPSLPADYDVERQGHYSAGKFKRPKKATATAPKKQGVPTSTQDPSQQ